MITHEYPNIYSKEQEPYYPVNDKHNNEKYQKYADLNKKESNVYFGGRLAEYKYYDMDKIILSALNFIEQIT